MGMCTRVKSASLCNFHPKNFSPPPAKFRRGFERGGGRETRGSRKEGIDLHPVNEAVDDPMAIKTRGKTDSTSGYVFSDGPILNSDSGLYGQGKTSYDCTGANGVLGESLGERIVSNEGKMFRRFSANGTGGRKNRGFLLSFEFFVHFFHRKIGKARLFANAIIS